MKDDEVKSILERWGTVRTYEAKASNSNYYDFMVGEKKIHIRFSDHFKDDKDDKDCQIHIISAGDAYVLKYNKMTITKPAREFPKYLEMFLTVFPDTFRIVENCMNQTEQNCQQFLDMKTQYETLRKEFREYKEAYGDNEELSKKLEERNMELRILTAKCEALESGIRMYKDKLHSMESEIPAFLLLNELKDTYGKVIEEANQGLRKIKDIRNNIEKNLEISK